MKPPKYIFIIVTALALSVFAESVSYAFWLFTPKDKTFVNPKYAAKDTPQEQFDWAMRFYEEGDFERAAEEFERLTQSYKDSDLAPDAQYYAGRSREEQGKYWPAFQNYKKTVRDYPYTSRMDEILERMYTIAGILDSMETSKLMEIELSVNMERSAEIYSTIVETSPFSPVAVESLFKAGDVYRRMRKYNEAVAAYEKIMNDHPESPLVPEARYQLAYAKYEASLNPEYDQESTDKALEEFKKISGSTETPELAGEADRVIIELRNKKAASTLQIAQFYDKQNKNESALLYYRSVAGKFPDTDAAEYATERIKHLEERTKK
jgi:outer membrane protein assembly factor BamD